MSDQNKTTIPDLKNKDKTLNFVEKQLRELNGEVEEAKEKGEEEATPEQKEASEEKPGENV